MAKAVTEEKLADRPLLVDLFGEFRFKVDAKGRMALPAKFRKVLPSELIVSRELQDECLYVFTPDTFNEWVEQLFIDRFGGYNASDRRHVLMRSKLKSRADEVEIDSSGRIMLKPELREACSIEREVVVVGNTGHFEIWDASTYDKTMDDIDLGAFYESDKKKDSDWKESALADDLELRVAR
ncbi:MULTISPECIES: division/cell wall cluster transcriptional repressor MraZ [unclassified Adlercreutzia]|uniref:division/cell wall cluster transcriptional repressor MraZ n=1 Tax=unclassified Adlercreutzia TaxID=2636013 RepID=UPI0013EA04D6|nr:MULTISPECIES: division/cell wall cluster transcriptional repressor MraZ [unclassified Adlercreutzia]